MSFEVIQEVHIAPDGPREETLSLSPTEVCAKIPETAFAWPLFFDYDVDGNRLAPALDALGKKYPLLCGRLVPHETLLYVVNIKPGGDEEKFGFPFVELRTELTLAEMFLQHGHLICPIAEFPMVPELPFFLDTLDTDEVLKGEAPIFKVRLVHCRDGCSLMLAMSHAVSDADRYMEVYRDLGRAYRGVEIPDRTFDRSSQWPDGLVKHYPFLGDEVASLPRVAKATPDQVRRVHCYPDETASMEAIFLSKEVTEEMKRAVRPYLAEGEYVSTNDLIVAMLWMLSSELETDDDSGDDALPMANRSTLLAMEFLKNGINIVPETFFGSASLLKGAGEGLDWEGKPYVEIFARAALLVRKAVTDVRTQPRAAAQMLLGMYFAASGKRLPGGRTTIAVSNLTKTCYREADFGQGRPVLAQLMTLFPWFEHTAMVGPAPGNMEGVILYMQFRQKHLEKLKASKVMGTCAPGMKLLYSDVSVEELQAMMKS